MDPKHLGKPSTLPASPEEAILDYVPNPRPATPAEILELLESVF